MEPNPYTFDEKNPRLVVNCERDPKLFPLAGGIFLMSVYMFQKKRFRVDGNVINLLGFTAGAAPASLVYANMCCGDSAVEAGIMNNERETGK